MANLPLEFSFDEGLREDLVGREQPTAAVIARNVEFDTTTGPTKRTGFVKVATDLPSPAALRLDGRHTVGIINPTKTGGTNLVLGVKFTMVVHFLLRAPEPGAAEPSTNIWEYSEGTMPLTNLTLQVNVTTDGQYKLRAFLGDVAGTASENVQSTIALQVNKVYTAAVRYGQSSGTGSELLSVRIFGEEDWQDSSVLGGAPYQPSSAVTDIHVHIGGRGREVANVGDGSATSRMNTLSAIDIHRVRAWTTQYLDPDTTETPTFDYQFTDMTSREVADAQSAAPNIVLVDSGQAALTSGGQRADHRASAQWETTSPLVGTGSVKFNGYTDYLRLPAAFRYRKPIVDFENLSDDEDIPEFPERNHFGVSVVVKFDVVDRSQGICHMTPVRTTSNNSTPSGTGDLYFALWLDENSSSPRIAWSWGTGTGANETLYSVPGTYAIAADTEYLIFASRDVVTGETYLKITDSSAAWDYEVDNLSASTTANDPVEGSKFDDRKSKYAFILGSLIRGTRYAASSDNPDDPNDFRLRVHYEYMFEGTLDSFCFYALERETGGAGAVPKEFILQLLDRDLTQENITAMAGQFRVLSAYFFNEGTGEITFDKGLLGNHMTFIEDPSRLYVRNQSGLTIAEAAPSSVDALTEQDHPIYGRKAVVLAGPGLYEINEAAETLTAIGEGIRNDSNSQAHINRYGTDIIICTDGSSRPWRYNGEALFPLGVETLDSSRVRYGLVMQGYERGAMEEGTRRYRIVYFSDITGEEGDWDSEISVKIPAKMNANVGFGATASDDSTAESVTIKIRPNQRAASIDSPTDGPWDITAGVTDWTEAVLNIEIAGGGPGSEASRFTHTYVLTIKRSDVQDPQNVTAQEMATVLTRLGEYLRAFKTKGRRKVRLLAAYLGKVTNAVDSKIQVTAEASLGSTQSDLFTVLGFNTGGALASGEDAGNSLEPLPLPQESPQATHIYFYKTTASGSVFHLAGQVVIGDALEGYTQGTYWIDDVSDDDLVFRPTMNERKGRPPKASMSLTLGNRVIYAGDEDFPQRMSWSIPDRPDIVEPFAFADILGGGELEITALATYAGVGYVHKERATYTVTPVSAGAFPYAIALRKPDVGCSSRFGVITTQNAVYVADPSFPRHFDTLTYRDPGYKVNRSWREDITATQQATIVGVHRPQSRQIIFAVPDGDAYVYHYGKRGAWSKYTNLKMRCVTLLKQNERVARVMFGDEYGNVFRMSTDAFNDGGNFITDAAKVNETLTGTGFVVSGTTITLTGFTVTEAQSSLVRGLKLYLVDGSTTTEARALRVDASGNVIVEATTDFADATYASGTWSWCRIDAEYQSGEINAEGNPIRVKSYNPRLESLDGWPTSHTVTMVANLLAGVATRGELEKSIYVADNRTLLGFEFQARAFRWGIKEESPDKPFSVSSIAIDASVERRRGAPH